MRSRRQRLRLRPCARRALIIAALRPEPVSFSDQRQFVPRRAILATIYELFVIPVTDVDRAKRFYGDLGWWLDPDYKAGDTAARRRETSPRRLLGQTRSLRADLPRASFLLSHSSAMSEASGLRDTGTCGPDPRQGRLN
jgi:hypothetical protein